MGNQLAGIAPSQIFPVEYYLNQTPSLQFQASMGSTRFMKVARANCSAGSVVVKVFVLHDAGVPVHEQRRRCEHMAQLLTTQANCVPFCDTILLERCALLVRQHIRYSLYDRISTRPFLSVHEKRWLSFQLLSCLARCHRIGVCHGDLKLENLLVTSTLWLMIADWASYKPALLPDDNPADFGYFFDTSRRRLCYLAPERFVGAGSAIVADSLVDNEAREQEEREQREGCERDAREQEGIEQAESAESASSSTIQQTSQQQRSEVLSGSSTVLCDAWSSCGGGGGGVSEGDGLVTPAMDLFSAGCCLIELWTDGSVVPFDLQQLLAYRCRPDEGVLRLRRCLEPLVDGHVLALLLRLVSLRGEQRGEAADCLRQFSPHVFPASFSRVLHPYLSRLHGNTTLSADQLLFRLASDVAGLLAQLAECSPDGGVSTGDISLLLTIATSCVRRLRRLDVKLSCLRLLFMLCQRLPRHARHSHVIIVDRVLPYVLAMTHDHRDRRVRMSALRTVTRLLQLAEELSGYAAAPASDAHCEETGEESAADLAALMSEYVLPEVAPLVQDADVGVRRCYASQLPLLADTALARLMRSHQRRPRPALAADISALHRVVQLHVQQLLSDGDPAVCRTLLIVGFPRLCRFFGRHRAADLLLSHMVTFLNDNGDRPLRAAFYATVDRVVSAIGRHCVPPLTPLLLQGLADCDELVATAAVDALARLAQASCDVSVTTDTAEQQRRRPDAAVAPTDGGVGLLSADAVQMALGDVAPLLLHPSLWLRHACVGFLSACASRLSPVDVHCRLMPCVVPVLRAACAPLHVSSSVVSLVDAGSCEHVLALLGSAVRRSLLDVLLAQDSQLLRPLLNCLAERRAKRKRRDVRDADAAATSRHTDSAAVNALLRRLQNDGLDERGEQQLLLLSAHLVKCQQQRRGKEAAGGGGGGRFSSRQVSGVLSVVDAEASVVHVVSLTPTDSSSDDRQHHWLSLAEGRSPAACRQCHTASATCQHHTLPSCAVSLSRLVRRLRDAADCSSPPGARVPPVGSAVATQVGAAAAAGHQHSVPADWRPRGHLVAHLHEHQGAVVRLAVVPDTGVFMSAGTDGTVRVWDVGSMERRSVANRSARVLQPGEIGGGGGGGHASLTALVYDSWRDVVAAADATGAIYTMSLQTSGDQQQQSSLTCTKLDRQRSGCVAEMHFLQPHVLVYATDYGQVIGWDQRSRADGPSMSTDTSDGGRAQSWQVQTRARHGLVTAMCVDRLHNWITVGTSSGVHVCWDLRFLLPVATLCHPFGARVRRLAAHPSQPSWFISAVSSNCQVDMWNIETAERQMTLWCGDSPVLSASQKHADSVCALHVPRYGATADAVITAGTDMCCRLWTLRRPTHSQMLSSGRQATDSAFTLNYRHQVVDGIEVIHECSSGAAATLSDAATVPLSGACPRGPPPPAPGHLDTISDVVTVRAGQWMFVTAARDGVVKVWK